MNEDDEKKIFLPDGKTAKEFAQEQTQRAKERSKENKDYIPVIIKRNDESIRHPDDVLEKAIHEGVVQHKRPWLSLFLSAIAAGLILGFAAMSVSVTSVIFSSVDNPLFQRLAMAIVYPLGFIICVMSGTQLFTEHTATAVYPVLDKKSTLKSLILLWIIVLAGNLTGTFFSSVLLTLADPVVQAKQGVLMVAEHLTHFSFGEIFVSAILAGWLMAQGGWLVLATPPATSQVMCIYVVTFIIGLGGLHHSIAGSAEIFCALLQTQDPNYYAAFKTISSSVLGNLLGGSFFVAILNYGHIRQTQHD